MTEIEKVFLIPCPGNDIRQYAHAFLVRTWTQYHKTQVDLSPSKEYGWIASEKEAEKKYPDKDIITSVTITTHCPECEETAL